MGGGSRRRLGRTALAASEEAGGKLLVKRAGPILNYCPTLE